MAEIVEDCSSFNEGKPLSYYSYSIRYSYMNLIILFIIIFIRAILTVIYQRRHLLIVLLRLERVTLILVFILLGYIVGSPYIDSYLFIVVLAYGAIEAGLGLALLVSISRKAGNDLVSCLTLRKC